LNGERKHSQTQQDVDVSVRISDHQRNQNFSSYRGSGLS
jgi:hypothetical protein